MFQMISKSSLLVSHGILPNRLFLSRCVSLRNFSVRPPVFQKFSVPSNEGPLAGVRVLDLTRVLAGPYCTMLLGDMGAEVIKIENPRLGDDTRAWGPPWAANIDPNDSNIPESAYFLAINRNKKSVTVNFKHPSGLAIVNELVKHCDVLVENYIPGKLDEMGLGWEQLKKVNPRLIYASITGYGPTGPYAKRAGYDVMIEAEAGFMHITGERNGKPVKVGVAITDLTTGLYAHGAILACLLRRSVTNLGQKIDCSLLESQIASLANIGSNYLIGSQEAQRMGTSHPSIVPYQVIPTKNSFIMIGAGNDGQFKKLCKVIGRDEWAKEDRFKSNVERVKNREPLIKLLEDRLQEETTEKWLEMFDDSGIPFAPINNIEQTYKHPQVLARGMVQEVEHPRAGKIKLTGIPVKYSESKPSIRLPPPYLGQHTHEVLSEFLNYDKEKLDSLTSEGVI